VETLERTPSHAAVPDFGSVVRWITRWDWAALATSLLAAVLVAYLALENGGYDPIPRDQVGLLVWWVVLLGVSIGALPVPGRTRAGLAALGLLLGFTVWTGLALIWTESTERTMTEFARVATYLGVLVLGVCLATRSREAARHVLHGVTFGLALVAALGVLSRLHMAWFPPNELGKVFPGFEIERRLAYPLNYSSAVGALAGMTLPLLLGATASAKTIPGKALAAAALPIAGLALYLATSGTGVAAAAIGLLAYIAIAPDRLPKLLVLATGALGATILAMAVDGRGALARGLPTSAAEQQGTEVLWIAIAVCVLAAVVSTAIALAAERWERPPWMLVSKRNAIIATVVVVVMAAPIAIAAGVPNKASDRWETFKARTGGGPSGPSAPSTAVDFKGNGRYQFWVASVDAYKTTPVRGIGPGTFEFWWARNGSYGGFVRDAHSLYLENLAELGVVGFLLITGFVCLVLGTGAVRSVVAPPEERIVLAAATAGAAGFATAAAFDWVWEIAALPVAFMLLAAVAVSGFSLRDPTRRRRRRNRRIRNRAQRVSVGVASVCALVIIWMPLQGAISLRDSQADAAKGELDAAYREAADAVDAQPYAASPRMQEAVILEQQGQLGPAAAAARSATQRERTNWRTWLILSRIEAERGRVTESLSAYRAAKALNPRSKLFRAARG
jgi:hypothetical protein